MRSLFCILLFLIGAVAFADDCNLILSLKESVRQTRADWLTADDLKKISEAHANPALNSHEKAQTVFNLYADARLRDLSPDLQTELRRILKEAEKRIIIAPNRTDTRYDLQKERIYMETTPDLDNSAIFMANFAHEFEHAIQSFTVKGEIKSFFQKIETIYLLEEGAMIAEAKYLKAIPASERAKLIEAVAEMDSSKIHPKDKKHILRMLKNADKEIDSYLAAERRAFNYSRTQIFWNSNEGQKIIGSAIISATILGGGLAIMYMSCKAMRNDLNPQNPSDDPTPHESPTSGPDQASGFYYHKICEGLFRLH